MGMFDQVEVPPAYNKCPFCDAELSDWQSKDGPCELKLLQYYEVDQFYTSCDSCSSWIQYDYTKRHNRTMSDYTRHGEEMDDE